MQTPAPDDHDHPVDGGRGGHGGHDHGHVSISAGARHKGRLVAALGVLVVFLVAEVIGALLTNSLALLSDAGHMLTDVLGIGMALAAIQLASRGSSRSHRTFGLYRLEILAALANAMLLFGVAGWVIYEAVGRIGDPVEVASTPMLVVAVAGLLANVVAFVLLRGAAEESLNVRGAYLEVVADLVGSVGVIVGAVLIGVTGETWIDPVIGVGIGLFILPRTWSLGAQAVRILVQAAPPGTDLEAMASDLEAIEGVTDVHDLHVWTLTSAMDVASAHVMVSVGTDHHGVLDQARDLLLDRYGIGHATLQVEPDDHRGCEEVTW
ncbi:MAG: cation transporter [Actinobacteria bacterium]|nr:cation transporter [Actinomycetota bacterium]